MKALKIFIIVLLFTNINNTYADHFVGYDMCLVNIKNSNGTPSDTYKWVMKIFRDVNGLPIPISASFEIYNQTTNAQVGGFTCTKINAQTFLTYPPEECPPAQAQLAVEVGVYESPVINYYASLNNTGGYYVSSSSCCRNIGIMNVPAPSLSFGMTFTMDFPRLNPGSPTRYNSSPKFIRNPLTFFSVGKLYSLNWQVTDPDGDSLVFSLAQPLGFGSVTKPFELIPYAAGYGLNSNIMDGSPDLTINPNTGIINFKPTIAGKYLVAFKVDEYRKIAGIPTKIGSIRREFQLNTVINIELPPVISDQGNRLNTIKDTIYVIDTTTYLNRFNAKEQLGDSVFLKIIPQVGLNQNILNSTQFNVKWGYTGGTNFSGNSINNLILASKDSIKTTFTWKIDSTDIKRTPYHFKVISFDKTCPSPLEDTLNVELYVIGQCFNARQHVLVGCDSLVDFLGRKFYSSTNTLDTIQGSIGCDTIVNQYITINHSSRANIYSEGCDSVLGINGQYYYASGDVDHVYLLSYRCDSIITQHITVYQKPKPNVINGNSSITDITPTYYYGTAQQNGVNYTWTVQNGNIISGQGTNVIEVKWLSTAIGRVNCFVFDSSMKCTDSSHLNINKTTGLTDINATSLNIYPNPTNNLINIKGLPEHELTPVNLFNTQGKLILSKELPNSGTIDLSSFSQGVYVIKIGEVVQRVVKL